MVKEQTGKTDSSSCVKCGKCQTVCPIYSVRPEESSAARGKLALSEAVAQGHLDESKVYRDYLETCLLCGACEENCPNEVKTLSAMLGARRALADNARTKVAKRAILKQVVGAPRLLDLGMRIGRAFMGLVFRRIPSDSGVRRRIPLPLITGDRTLPNLAPAFFTDRFSGQVVEGAGPRVGIFAGCMTNYFYPKTGETMVDLLKGLGASVYVPKDQVCCGMPALTGGERETVRKLARRNLEAFEKYQLDVIVTGCASCGGNLKENYGEFLREGGIDERRIEKFISSILDINEYIYKYGEAGSPVRCEGKERAIQPGTRVTYHHPCHLGRVQGITEEPVELIRSLPGIEYIPLEDGQRCCGMGGSFSLEHYDISKKVNDQKVARILETGADIVVTSCPACIMHIQDGLVRNGRDDIEVMHITELLKGYECVEQNAEESAAAAGRGDGDRQSTDLKAQVSG
jgi:glycolate oxidase iron-sulfur subunit